MNKVQIINQALVDQMIYANDVSNPDTFVRDDEEIGTLPASRTPFVMSCSSWMKQEKPRYIIWRVNPREVSWTIQLRQVDRKMQAGVASHVWKDKVRGTYFDEPVLRFSFQTGNIMPIPTAAQVSTLRGLSQQISTLDPQVSRSEADINKTVQARAEFLASSAVAAGDKEIADLRLAAASVIAAYTDPKTVHANPLQAGEDLQAAVESIDARIAKIRVQQQLARENALRTEQAVMAKERNALLQQYSDLYTQRKNAVQMERPLIPPGLFNFYSFLDLMDEQRILTDPKDPTFGQQNLVYLFYNSNIFPQLTLRGTLTPEGTSWTDAASDPFQVDNWNASFTVHETSPRLTMQQLVATFQEIGFRRGIG